MNRFLVTLAVIFCAVSATAFSQDAAFPEPVADSAPPETPTWTTERTQTNERGTVSNMHRLRLDDSGNPVARQHVVTNPRGEMTQTRERVQTEEGVSLQRSQTFMGPDGTVLRQHQSTRTGPGSFSREHQVTLPDGRTMTRTQTRDRETGTMERSFTGPNGQTRESQRTNGASATEGSSWFGWLKKLNPFAGGDHPRAHRNANAASRGPHGSADTAKPSPRRGGFTIGAGAPRGPQQTPRGLSQSKPGGRPSTARGNRVGQLTPRPVRQGPPPRVR